MTRKVILPIEIELLEEGRFLAICDAIQGCHAEGDTVGEALENIEDIARILLELRKEDGLPAPEGLDDFTTDISIKAQVVVTAPE
jgi:predicted RNase H-like HicB family nuclease